MTDNNFLSYTFRVNTTKMSACLWICTDELVIHFCSDMAVWKAMVTAKAETTKVISETLAKSNISDMHQVHILYSMSTQPLHS